MAVPRTVQAVQRERPLTCRVSAGHARESTSEQDSSSFKAALASGRPWPVHAARAVHSRDGRSVLHRQLLLDVV